MDQSSNPGNSLPEKGGILDGKGMDFLDEFNERPAHMICNAQEQVNTVNWLWQAYHGAEGAPGCGVLRRNQFEALLGFLKLLEEKEPDAENKMLYMFELGRTFERYFDPE